MAAPTAAAPPPPPAPAAPLRDLVAGGVAGAANLTAGYAFDTVKVCVCVCEREREKGGKP